MPAADAGSPSLSHGLAGRDGAGVGRLVGDQRAPLGGEASRRAGRSAARRRSRGRRGRRRGRRTSSARPRGSGAAPARGSAPSGVIALEDVERLADRRAAARRRPHPPDVEAAVADAGRLAPRVPRSAPISCSVISPGRQTWFASAAIGGSPRRGGDRSGDRAVVEAAGAAPGDPLVGPRHVAVAQPRADVTRGAVRVEVDAGGGRHVVEEVDVRRRLVEEGLVDREAPAARP